MHNTKTYATINIDDVGLIDFAQISETSIDTIRKSIDTTQFVIKWQHEQTPTFISNGSVVPIGTYDHHDVLELMSTPEWTTPE